MGKIGTEAPLAHQGGRRIGKERGRAADAVRYYRQALAARPDFPQAQINLGHALMALGKYEDAQSIWQRN